MSKILGWFNNEYEKILYSGLSKEQKNMEYVNIMSEMEDEFNIPVEPDKKWEKENRETITLYRKISKSRVYK